MTPQDRVNLAREIVHELLQTKDSNPVHEEYLHGLVSRINEELLPVSEVITEDASRAFFEEILKVSSVILFSRAKKTPSCRVTKKYISKYFKTGKPLYDSFKEMKQSRYGLAMMSMNFSKFMKGIEK